VQIFQTSPTRGWYISKKSRAGIREMNLMEKCTIFFETRSVNTDPPEVVFTIRDYDVIGLIPGLYPVPD
jgi:hypothetical protein